MENQDKVKLEWTVGKGSEEFTRAEMQYLDFQHDRSGGFTTTLFRLIGKADQTNREKVRKAFPDHVAAYEAWTQGDLSDRARRVGRYKD